MNSLRKNSWRWLTLLYIAFAGYLFCLPHKLFDDPLSAELFDTDGQLLGARIAEDEQWRLPLPENIPNKFVQALVLFEDKRFWQHPGFDPLALTRAFLFNIKSRTIVSGGSTLSMQVIRLSRRGRPRNVVEKVVEITLATRLELRYSKREILKLYASYAPFGGNVVGLEAASWRYYGKPSELISWAEAAALAVLPNSPALIHPGRNRELLLKKRNALLGKLLEQRVIPDEEYNLAIDEPLPGQPHPLPNHAPHLLDELVRVGNSGRISTTVKLKYQQLTNDIVRRHVEGYKNTGIHNAAAVIIDLRNNHALAYVGNAPNAGSQHGEHVNILKAPRSSGSILKPFLYAATLHDGQILPDALVSDIPFKLNGYQPENFSSSYDGVVSCRKALARSLNVPFVKMLQQYGVAKFHQKLKELGMTTLHRPYSHYGLSLILGGAECTLWDITNMYAGMARQLAQVYRANPQGDDCAFRKAALLSISSGQSDCRPSESQFLSADAIWFTLEAMQSVERPSSQGIWERFSTSRRVAWKTGTSFGFRDAWAVGVTPDFAVGVWVGNADGEGVPGLVGIRAAAPILFDLIDVLPTSKGWFDPPYEGMPLTEVCTVSGHLATPYCTSDTVLSISTSLRSNPCPFHQLVHLDAAKSYRVTRDCYRDGGIGDTSWFVLPPVEEYYFRKKNPAYLPVPPIHPLCQNQSNSSQSPIAFLYPTSTNTVVFSPRDFEGKPNPIVLKAAHSDPGVLIHWHVDNEYLGTTQGLHTMEIRPSPGIHRIVIVDENGYSALRTIEIKTQ